MRESKIPVYVSRKVYPVIPMYEIKHGYGISIYKDVVIVWDEEFDTRVFDLVDKILEEKEQGLLSVSEHEGVINLLWQTTVPLKYRKGAEQIEIGFDLWTINKSYSLYKMEE